MQWSEIADSILGPMISTLRLTVGFLSGVILLGDIESHDILV
jgi:hypothetical protein